MAPTYVSWTNVCWKNEWVTAISGWIWLKGETKWWFVKCSAIKGSWAVDIYVPVLPEAAKSTLYHSRVCHFSKPILMYMCSLLLFVPASCSSPFLFIHSVTQSLTHSFIQKIQTVYHVPDAVLNAGNLVARHMHISSTSCEGSCFWFSFLQDGKRMHLDRFSFCRGSGLT